MSWTDTVLSTNESLQKWESEILQLTDDGGKQYYYNNSDISNESRILQTTPFQEIIGVAETSLSLSGVEIKLQESDDGSIFGDYGTGRLYYGNGSIVEGTELFRYIIPTNIKDYTQIKISGSGSGNISIYVKNRWQDKIDMAKEILGVDLELRLLQEGYSVDYSEGENILDLISNPEIFRSACDFKTLELIYTDLAVGMEDNIYQRKAEIYATRYKKELERVTKVINIDYDLDGTADAYKKSVDYGGEYIR